MQDNDTRPWALITGASAGIGAEFARQLGQRGYSLVLIARREQRLRELGEEIGTRHGVGHHCLALDLARPDAAQQIERSLATAGIVPSFLVNNAGYGVPGTFNEVEWSVHADSLQVMLVSVCELTWRLLPAMQRAGRGYIVNVASLAGLVPGSARHTLYAATKAFLIRFSESLAMENADTGVKVSALCPGFTWSEFHDVVGSREQVNQMPRWMWMEAEDVVRYGIESVVRERPRIVAVPGRFNRFVAMLFRKLPLRWAQVLTQKQSRRWRPED